MKLTVLVVIFTSEILGIFGIIVYDGTKEPPKDQGSRRFGLQHAEPSEVSQQQVSPSDGIASGFSSVVVHRPSNVQQSQSEDHSGGGLTVQDPPKGWPLSEMHISFDSHGNDENWIKSKEVKPSAIHKAQRQRPNQVEQPFNKPLQEPLLHKNQRLHLTKRQPDHPQPQQQRHPQEHHRQLHQYQETQQQNIYQQQPQKENLQQYHEKTEVEIHPQVIIKLPEQQTASLLRPLYVQDQTSPQKLPSSLSTQEKPFHPSVQISDSINNEAMLTPVQYHGGNVDGFFPMAKKPVTASPKVPDPASQISNNKAKKAYLIPGTNEEKRPRETIKTVRMRHPHTTIGASYSVGFSASPDAFKNGNQLQNLIIKEYVENKVPIRHGKTLHRQKAGNGVELNNESVVHSKNVSPLHVPTSNISPENYAFLDGGRHQVGISSEDFPSAIHYQTALINSVSPGAHSSSVRLHQSPTGQHSSPHLTFEEPRQLPIGALHYQKLLSRDLLPPPVRVHASPEGKPGGTSPSGYAPTRAGHSNSALTSNKVISFVSGGASNNAFNEANLHYISEPRPAVAQNYHSLLQPHFTSAGAHDSGNEKGNQGSATTGKAVSSGPPVSQNLGHRQTANSAGPSDFHGFTKTTQFYTTTQGHSPHLPPKIYIQPHTQQTIEAPKQSISHTKVTASDQANKNVAVPDSPSQSNNPGTSFGQHGSQKTVEDVFAGFRNGQFQGGFAGNLGYSLAGHNIRNTFTQIPQVHLGSNPGNVGGLGQNIVLQFNKDTSQNIPGYLNVNSGALHLGHPAGPFVYPQQALVQRPGGHVQTLYVPGVGAPHAVYGNNLLGVGGQHIATPTVVTNIQPSVEIPINQGHTSGLATPATYSGSPLTYFGGHLLNADSQGNTEVNGQLLHHGQGFPGIGGAYPQNVQLPFNGGTGTTFVFSQPPVQDYRQQAHLHQALPVGKPQHSNTSPNQVNYIPTKNARLPTSNLHANSFGTKLTQQQHPVSQHVMKSSSSQHPASTV